MFSSCKGAPGGGMRKEVSSCRNFSITPSTSCRLAGMKRRYTVYFRHEGGAAALVA